MKSLHNIEPSGFRSREYVGYGRNDVWRIKRLERGGWIAHAQTHPDNGSLRGRTLAELSDRLAGKPAGIPCSNMREFDRVMKG